jgi:proton-dependent oligopeptide transporter, POT family
MSRTNNYPKGLFSIFFLFVFLMVSASIYQGVLVLYLTKRLFFSDAAAYTLFATFSALQAMSGLYGGAVAGRLISHRWSVVVGLLMMALGIFMLSSPARFIFMLGLSLYAIGMGFTLPNCYYLVGRLYQKKDARRDSGFTLIYTALNVGALFGLFGAGYIIKYVNYTMTFKLSALMLVFGTVLFFAYFSRFKPEPQDKRITLPRHGFGVFLSVLVVWATYFLLRHLFFSKIILLTLGGLALLAIAYFAIRWQKTQAKIARHLWLLLFLFFLYILFWSLYNLDSTVLMLFMDRNVNRHLFQHIIPTTTVFALNPIYMIFLGVGLSCFWLYLNKGKRKITFVTKFSAALLAIGAAFFLLYVGVLLSNSAGLTNVIWVMAAFFFISVGEMIIAPAGYAMVSQLVPVQWQSLMLGVVRLMVGVAIIFSGLLSQLAVSSHALKMHPFLTNGLYRRDFLGYGLLAFFVGGLVLIVCRQRRR